MVVLMNQETSCEVQTEDKAYSLENFQAILLTDYFKNQLKPSKLPFNIMKIIDFLDEEGSGYSIDEVLAIANIPRKTLDKWV